MLFANLDVTMGALSWNLVHLADNPNAQSELRTGLVQLATKAECQRYIQSSDTLLAAYRLIDEYNIPARTNLVVDTYALDIKNEYWGADRDVYRPGRFTGLTRSDLRYRFWRFGFGPRQCLGKYVADLILRTILATMVRKFTLHIPMYESRCWERDKEAWVSRPEIKLELEEI
ncbi:hypothetical protein PV10_01060 [Exophiala mesophila]|uniref:Uncharacterized protein n=1 Tax=Exophiala mesophila TaxID=212818 RepID=A0A0D2AEE9_EXOME|nr:uncharacterized protein PV10_01060 [Exophiala mesophila]KIV97293.1 hypothetical protein PV10_01060 [Exophiala mesophila]